MDPRTSFNFVGSKKYASVDNSLDATNSILRLTQENLLSKSLLIVIIVIYSLN